MGSGRWLDPSTAPGAFGFGVLLGTLLGVGWCGLALWRSHPPPGASTASPEGSPSTPASQRNPGPLLFPVPGGTRGHLASGFRALRGTRRHEAVDIFASRGTPVLAVSDGTLERLSTSAGGGRGLYHRDASGGRCYYYAHLDRYAPGLKAGQALARGQVIGTVGSSGNASADAPHLHFAVLRTPKGRGCPHGTPADPHPLLVGSDQAPTPRSGRAAGDATPSS